MEKITPAFLSKRNVIFVADKVWSVLREEDFIEEGSVIGVLEDRKEVMICFLYEGYKSTTQHVPFANVLAVYDPFGTYLEIPPFSGRGHDLRRKSPFGTHPLARTV